MARGPFDNCETVEDLEEQFNWMMSPEMLFADGENTLQQAERHAMSLRSAYEARLRALAAKH